MNVMASLARYGVEKLGRYVKPLRAYSFLKGITLYNRVQGSPGLSEALDFIEDTLERYCGECEIRRHSIALDDRRILAPPAWRLLEAEVYFDDKRFDSKGYSTLAVAHTPGGGPVEAEVIRVEKWWDPRAYRGVEGKIVLSHGRSQIVYKLAADNGAAGVVLYGERAPEEAFPYRSLFLSHSELQRLGIQAVTASRKLLGSRRIRIKIDSELGSMDKVEVLEARIPGKERAPRIAITAHICHPSPGANDNASGSAAALEAALALSEAAVKSEVEGGIPEFVFLWFPEYTGSLALLGTPGYPRVDYALNLDMVGVEPGGDEGPLRVYAPPATLEFAPASAMYYALKAIDPSFKWGVYPYSSGSDHDSFLSHGIPAVMLNQWPDTHYHTNLDDVWRIKPSMLGLAATAALAAGLALINTSGWDAAADIVTREWGVQLILAGDTIGAKLVYSRLREMLGLKPLTGHPESGELEELYFLPEEPAPSTSPTLIAGMGDLARVDLSAALDLVRLAEEEGVDLGIHFMEFQLLADGERSIRDIGLILASEHGLSKVKAKALTTVSGILERMRSSL